MTITNSFSASYSEARNKFLASLNRSRASNWPNELAEGFSSSGHLTLFATDTRD